MPGRKASLTLPLARWANRRLAELAKLAKAPAIARLTGALLLGERAAGSGFTVPHRRSPGGGCRLIEARDGWIALNLARDGDRDLLPAWLEAPALNPLVDQPVDRAIAAHGWQHLVARGREMGLALAAVDEQPANPAVELLCSGQRRTTPGARRPLVVDLSALWAGPLAGHLLWLAGAQVVKVESRGRPDALRQGDPALFAQLNQGKASVALDFTGNEDRAALHALLERADIVIEASRPRALRQLGIDAGRLVAAHPGKVWVTITGHGASGEAADWVGFGDDCAVAGGLSAVLRDTTGVIAFGGDAVADPLTGIAAAQEAWWAWQRGQGCRIGLAMSGVVALAIHEESEEDAARFGIELLDWAGASGQPFPPLVPRQVTGILPTFGENTLQWLERKLAL